MTQELENRQPTDDRPIYEAPRALRLGDPHAGLGLCATGSGDAVDCQGVGNTAGANCASDGSTAAGNCSYSGNAALITCDLSGNAPG